MEKNVLDLLLKKGAAEDRKNPPADAWSSIAAALHKKRRRRFFLIFFVCALSLGSVATFVLLNKEQGEETANREEIKQNLFENVNKKKNQDETDRKSLEPLNKQKNGFAKTDNIVIINKGSELKINDIALQLQKQKQKNKQKNNRTFALGKKEYHQNSPQKPDRDLTINTPLKNTEFITEQNGENSNAENNIALKSKEHLTVITGDSSKSNSSAISEKKESETKNLPVKIKVQPKWRTAMAVNYQKLYINLFADNSFGLEKIYNNSMAVNSNTDNYISPSYTNGFALNGAYLWKKNTKNNKIQVQIGASIQYGQFSSQVYSASWVKIFERNNSIIIDSNSFYNSTYAARPTSLLGFNQLAVKNNYLQLGFIAGLQTNLLKIAKDQKISLQVQLIPVINLSQSLLWYDNNSQRYFTDKNLNRNFSIQQSTAIFYEFNLKHRKLAIGPNFNYSFSPLNKNITNLKKIQPAGLGLQLQIGLQ